MKRPWNTAQSGEGTECHEKEGLSTLSDFYVRDIRVLISNHAVFSSNHPATDLIETLPRQRPDQEKRTSQGAGVASSRTTRSAAAVSILRGPLPPTRPEWP